MKNLIDFLKFATAPIFQGAIAGGICIAVYSIMRWPIPGIIIIALLVLINKAYPKSSVK